MNAESLSHVYLKFIFIFHQIMMLWREKFTEQIPVKAFLQKLKEWESGGFITMFGLTWETLLILMPLPQL